MFDQFKKIIRDVKWAFGNRRETSEESIKLLLSREIGMSVPVSIGTALIVESDNAALDKWESHLLINIRTLVRNIIGSVDYSQRTILMTDDIVDILIEEMDILKQVLPDYKPGLEISYYLPDYSGIMHDFKHANPKLYDTEKLQWEYIVGYRVCQRMLEYNRDKDHPVKFIECGWKLERDKRPTTLLTSFPSDLLSQYQFPKMNLLESHTGKIKLRRDWYSKLSGDRDVNKNIPFNKFTLTVFGDGVFFLVVNRKVKRIVLEMASRDKWNYTTTDARIKMSISHIRHEEDRKILLDMF